MADEPDLTPDEIAEFEALGDDDKAKVERFLRWRGQKDKSAGPAGGSKSDPHSDLSLSQLKKIVTEHRSILKYFLEIEEASPKEDKAKPTRTKVATIFPTIKAL